MDVGVYTLNFAAMILGDRIIKSASTCSLFETGVDSQGSMTLLFEGVKWLSCILVLWLKLTVRV